MTPSPVRIVLFFVLALVGLCQQVYAGEFLSELALFHRCYGHLTQSRPARNDPLLADVKAGRKSAVQACTEVLDRARFLADSGTRIQDPTDVTAKAVLQTLHQLHRSWAREQQLFSPTDTTLLQGSEPWFDDSPYGSYVSRALFSPGVSVESVTQGTTYLQSVRTTMNPPHSYAGVPSTTATRETDFRLGAQHPFAPRGELLGIRPISLAAISWTRFGDLTNIPDFAAIGTPGATQTITQIDMPDLAAVRGPLTVDTQFAVRIRGQLLVPQAGSYTLFVDVNDGAVLLLDGALVLSKNISATAGSEGSVVRALTAGSHNLELRYRQRSGAAKLSFSWQGPSIAKQVVPASALSGLRADYYSGGLPQTVNLTGSEGGGFIGNHNYLLTTFNEALVNFVPDGAERTNRSWARAVLSDALCRELPVVREADVVSFVNPASAVPFRQAAACTACHATADRQASLIRGLRYNHLNNVQQDSPAPDWVGMLGVRMIAPTAALDTGWPDKAEANYGARPPYGHLFFRNYRGELVDRVVQSMEELGSAIRDQDDFYACFAKRYYDYFLGIEVNLGDPGDPSYSPLNNPDQYHRSKVTALGLELKRHGSLRQLILDILSSEDYRTSDFGVTHSGASS